MGVQTLSLDDHFVIASDFDAANPKAKAAPRRMPTAYRVWTGKGWSASAGDAMKFDTLDAADEYVRRHYVEIMKREDAG